MTDVSLLSSVCVMAGPIAGSDRQRTKLQMPASSVWPLAEQSLVVAPWNMDEVGHVSLAQLQNSSSQGHAATIAAPLLAGLPERPTHHQWPSTYEAGHAGGAAVRNIMAAGRTGTASSSVARPDILAMHSRVQSRHIKQHLCRKQVRVGQFEQPQGL